jgi:hypothetical protein
MADLIFILLIAGGLWYWWDTLQSNELALSVCRRKCDSNALQLLDSTVTRRRTWLRRAENGHVQICRLYSFEYSVGGGPGMADAGFGDRIQGYIVLLGKQLVETSLPHQQEYPFSQH